MINRNQWRVASFVLLTWLSVALRSSAEEFGLFTYSVDGGEITITDHPSVQGEIIIPAGIEGMPVTQIGDRAFESLTNITGVSIPTSVTSIGDAAFSRCSSLTGIIIPEGVDHIGEDVFSNCNAMETVGLPDSLKSIGSNAFYQCWALTEFEIPLAVTSIGEYAFLGCFRVARFTIPPGVSIIRAGTFEDCFQPVEFVIPEGVTAIEEYAFSSTGITNLNLPSTLTRVDADAFSNCFELKHVTIPPGVLSIELGAFFDCAQLTSALFLGDAPTMGSEVFGVDDVPPRPFTVYYLSGSAGFTSPTWEGYPAVAIDLASHPAVPWLLQHGFAHDVSLDQDLSGDGVSLLTAYALNLDPRENLPGSLPQPEITDDNLSLTFDALSTGVTYSAETSSDAQNWTSNGVTLSELTPNGRRTASVDTSSGRRFLRLRFSQ